MNEYATIRIGGCIGETTTSNYKGFSCNIIKESNDKNIIKEFSKRMRKTLSQGEKKYYRLNYLTVNKNQIKEI